MDYYTVITKVDSDGDIIEPIRYDAVKDYLCWKMLMRKNMVNEAQLYEQQYKNKVNEMLLKERSLNIKHFSPALNRINYTDSESSWDRRD